MRRLPINLRAGLLMFSVFFLSVGCATIAKRDVLVVVKKNDTLNTIAKEYGSSWESIVELNETTLVDGLREGQTLKVHAAQDPEILVAQAKETETSNSEENLDDEELDILTRPSKGLMFGPQSKEPISLIYPVESRISSHFGKRGRKNHKGIDLAANVGTPIVAAGDGEVIFSGRQRGYGLPVVVDHGQFMTLYAHASKLIARVGAKVHQSDFIAKSCQNIPNLKFPNYYPELSSERIITMDWMEGLHLSEFVKINTDKNLANKLGQTLWDFYMFQIHHLKQVHADPHPGNFLIDKDRNLVAIDFGCIKQIPDEFYIPYFELIDKKVINNPKLFSAKLFELEILRTDDSKEEAIYFTDMFYDLLSLFTQPFQEENFDFSDPDFFGNIAKLGERFAKDTNLRKMNGNRGSKHFIYMNRKFLGMYNLMFDLKAKIVVNQYQKYN